MNPAAREAFERYDLITPKDKQHDWPEFFTWMRAQFSLEGGPPGIQAQVSWSGIKSTIFVDKQTRRFCVIAGNPARAATARSAGGCCWKRMKLSTDHDIIAQHESDAFESYLKDEERILDSNYLVTMSRKDVEEVQTRLNAKPRYLKDDIPYYKAHLKQPDPVIWDL